MAVWMKEFRKVSTEKEKTTSAQEQADFIQTHRANQFKLCKSDWSKMNYDGCSTPLQDHMVDSEHNVHQARLKLAVTSGRGEFYHVPSPLDFPQLLSKNANWLNLRTDADIDRYNEACTNELDKVPAGHVATLVKILNNDFTVTANEKQRSMKAYANVMNPSNRTVYCGCCGVFQILTAEESSMNRHQKELVDLNDDIFKDLYLPLKNDAQGEPEIVQEYVKKFKFFVVDEPDEDLRKIHIKMFNVEKMSDGYLMIDPDYVEPIFELTAEQATADTAAEKQKEVMEQAEMNKALREDGKLDKCVDMSKGTKKGESPLRNVVEVAKAVKYTARSAGKGIRLCSLCTKNLKAQQKKNSKDQGVEPMSEESGPDEEEEAAAHGELNGVTRDTSRRKPKSAERKYKKSPTWFPFRNGYDIGNASRMGLPKLSLFQKLLLCPITMYGYTAQITSARGSSGETIATIPALRGHIISFANVHSRSGNKYSIPNDSVVARGGFNVTFVGTCSLWKKLKVQLETEFGDYFCHSHHEIHAWLLYLQKLHVCDPKLFPPGLTFQIHNLALLKEFCDDQYKILLNSARSSDDPQLMTLAVATTSDIARVRPSQDDDDIYKAPSGEPEIAIGGVSSTDGVDVDDLSKVVDVADDVKPVEFANSGLCHVMCSQGPSMKYDTTAIFRELQRLKDENEYVTLIHRDAIIKVAQVTAKETVDQSDECVVETSDGNVQETKIDEKSIDPLCLPGIRVERSEAGAVNEFLFNDKIILGAFFDVFPLGQGIVTKGSTSKEWRDHFLRLGTQQVASNISLLFLLFNQLQRHTACSGVSIKAKSNSGTFRRFQYFMSRPNLTEDIASAIANPDSSKTRKFLDQLLRCCSVVGKKVPFGDSQRRMGIITMMNEWRYFGCSSFFNTIPWTEVDCPLSCRLALQAASSRNYINPHDGEGEPYRMCQDIKTVPESREDRAKLVADHPILQAVVFERMNDAVNTHLYGLEIGANVKKTSTIEERQERNEIVKGLFGVLLCGDDAHEASGRGTMHTHHTSKSRGLTPDLMQKMSSYPPLMKIMAYILDQMFSCSINPYVFVQGEIDSALRFDHDHAALRDITPDECSVPKTPSIGNKLTPFESMSQTVAYNHCRHKHTASCHKGKAGLTQCRYAYLRALNDITDIHYVQPDSEQRKRHMEELESLLGDKSRPVCTKDFCYCCCCCYKTEPVNPFKVVRRTSVNVFEEFDGSIDVTIGGTSARAPRFELKLSAIPHEQARPHGELQLMSNAAVLVEGKRPEIDVSILHNFLANVHGLSYAELNARLPGGLPTFLDYMSSGDSTITNEQAKIEGLFPMPECKFIESLRLVLKNRNSIVVEFNDVISACCRCNNSIQYLGTLNQV